QVYGEAANKPLAELASDDAIREFVLRALTDRKTQLKDVPVELYVKSLDDKNPRVRVQALNGLARLGAKDAAPAILKSMAGMDLDPGQIDKAERRIVPHVAVKALASLGAAEACLAAVKDGSTRELALRALQEMHTMAAVDGLIAIAEANADSESTEGALGALARLHFKEAEWDLNEWWSTRPDDRGPYYRPTEWEASGKILAAIEANFEKVAEGRRSAFISRLADNRIPVSSLKLDGLDPVMLALSVQQPDDATLSLLSDATRDSTRDWAQRVLAYQAINRAEPKKAVPMQVKTLAAWVDAKEEGAPSKVADFVNETRRFTEVGILNNIGKKGSDTESMIAWKAMLTVLNSPLVKEQNKTDVRKLLETNPMEVGLFLAIEDMGLSGFDQQIEAGIASDNEKTIAAAKRA
ncbi:MAG TPA: hypothetical protein VLA37_00570, partial [Sphingomonadaceae bacterium]|nr:hypothetical protein [Sphingomonadaceae bacterium]